MKQIAQETFFVLVKNPQEFDIHITSMTIFDLHKKLTMINIADCFDWNAIKSNSNYFLFKVQDTSDKIRDLNAIASHEDF